MHLVDIPKDFLVHVSVLFSRVKVGVDRTAAPFSGCAFQGLFLMFV